MHASGAAPARGRPKTGGVKLTIAAIGRTGRGPERDLYEHYAGRIRWPLTLRELEEKKKLPPAQLIEREGELLLGAVPDKALLVALDRRGKLLDSEAFAKRLERWRDDSVAEVAFLIGGADGHTEILLKRASLVLSFGAMTWPHLLARAMLAEQIYRAQQLLAGHPYHRAS
jgi:23S rRNA (pseudouridine1915-N3)-methyltransferase